MIPLRLQMRNFMCYREGVPPLDFSGIHLACLTGDNGNGKSALLDAMTWALWARSRAKTDDDLISLGADEMEVMLDFELANTPYRVIRKRDRRGRGKSDLQFQVGPAGSWKSITEPTQRETQRRIDAVLHMDYETFINSAFLLQGRADEFTKKSPNDRKQILSEILGLRRFDGYEEQVKLKLRQAQDEGERLEKRIEEWNEEIAQRPQYAAQLEAAEAEAAAQTEALRTQEAMLQTLQADARFLESKIQHMEGVQGELNQERANKQRVLKKQAELGEQIRQTAGLIARQAEIEKGYRDLLAARTAYHTWSEALSERSPLVDEQNRLKTLIQQAQSRLDFDHKSLTDQLTRARKAHADRATAMQQWAELQEQVLSVADIEQQLENLRKQDNATTQTLATLQAQNLQLKDDANAIKEEIVSLQQVSSVCPTCLRPLDEDERQQMLAQRQSHVEEKRRNYRTNTESIAHYEAQQLQLRATIEILNGNRKALQPKAQRASKLEQLVESLAEEAERLPVLESQAQALVAHLSNRHYAQAEQAQLSVVEERLQAIPYDPAAHKQARDEVNRLAKYEQESHRLLNALESKPRIEQELAELTSALEDIEARIGLREARLQELIETRNKLEALKREVDQQQNRKRAAEEAVRNAGQRVGAARQRLDVCDALLPQKAASEMQLTKLRLQVGFYEELRTAFGRKGVQAMVIESAIPEIEEEANRLLARMSDGRMHVRLDTQRESRSRKGDTIETLDILLADELGSRPYEMYSGGECFRANLAIRIALSRLLARRAGAQLRTLVIDEGFGTQDAASRERLVDTINSIKDDFERILVITHLEDLKDLFPVRIDIEKTLSGSQIRLN